MEALPADIRNLPLYVVPSQLFICTAILLLILLIGVMIVMGVWIYRSCNHIHNYQYKADHEFIHYYKNKEQKIKQDQPEDHYFSSDQGVKSDSADSKYSVSMETEYTNFNRNQSRFLEFICLSVVMVINISAFSSNIFELVAFSIAIVLFLIFNILRVLQNRFEFGKILFFVPLIVCFIPFYIESKALNTK